uniref:PGG domain-containing protein n=1 Tax=Rhizophora mucronata TaxID=61149 RepID=A0A2P2J0W6_RHIMU
MRFKFLQHIYNTKLMHEQTCKIVKILCEAAIEPDDSLVVKGVFGPPMRTATMMGTLELVTEIIRVYPFSVWFCGGDTECNVFHLAVLHRKENIFNLIYQMNMEKNYIMQLGDKNDNNILHLAGMLGPSNKIAGAALQMQWELQWFKEVEKHVTPSFKWRRNSDKKLPSEVFTENHKELVKEGQQWMKNTATSYTVVAALVATFVFTAAFTPPGGNDSEGIPNFLNEPAFMIYAISDALSLFTSSTSMLMFLSIPTSRYSEEDFLKALPMRLSIGLITLFISIASMLLAFCAALYLMLVHRVKWIAAPIVLLACIPVTFFALLQFPLLLELVFSTFGPSIFGRTRKVKIW